MAPVETEFYDLLDVPVDADDVALKKGYRKQAMKYHPDKNPSVEAEERFKDISKAYQVLSDPNLRAAYDKNGKKMFEKEGKEVKVEDAAGFFANMFGGERFADYVGEITIMKEMTNAATSAMTDEEKAEVERQLNAHNKPQPQNLTAEAHVDDASTSSPTSPAAAAQERPSTANGTSTPSTSQPTTPAELARMKAEAREKQRQQREKLRQQDEERRKAMKARVKTLMQKLVERLRPFVEAKNPGGLDDPETKTFEAKIRREAEDLKLESFGVELLHAIGGVYVMKGLTFMKSRKMLGIPGFWSRMKEKGTFAKDLWGVIGSAFSVRDALQEMEKLQLKGDADEEELRAMEMDMTGKMLLASWRGARLEVVQVLREVVDNVLKEPGVPEHVLLCRAKGLILMGQIFKQTVPDESDEERRELERLVAEAAKPKPKNKKTAYVTHIHPSARFGFATETPAAAASTSTPTAHPAAA